MASRLGAGTGGRSQVFRFAFLDPGEKLALFCDILIIHSFSHLGRVLKWAKIPSRSYCQGRPQPPEAPSQNTKVPFLPTLLQVLNYFILYRLVILSELGSCPDGQSTDAEPSGDTDAQGAEVTRCGHRRDPETSHTCAMEEAVSACQDEEDQGGFKCLTLLSPA